MSDTLSPRARRMATLAGATWSYDMASDRLHELCGVRLSDQTIRRVCDRVGQEANQWIDQSPEAIVALEQSPGDLEFQTDGAMVNTLEGWREIRLGVMAKREAGRGVKPAQWADRYLPPAAARVAFCALACADEVGRRLGSLADRLGLGRGAAVSVVGDGAAWIWRQAQAQLWGPAAHRCTPS